MWLKKYLGLHGKLVKHYDNVVKEYKNCMSYSLFTFIYVLGAVYVPWIKLKIENEKLLNCVLKVAKI